ncbi:hypothetical protein WA026_019260 [Henosepilachna vigintioctopunctata]|uniref:Uncharacterized protein n=1 Tax=Henosepilachna vigintioctopunctata TaxID=420089 RepID=A0AAW1U9L7_9CUCU
MDNHSFCSNMQHRHGNNWTNRTSGIMQNQLCHQMSITHPNNHHNICSQTHQYMNQRNQTEMSSTNNFNMAMRVQENMNPCANHYSLMCNQNALMQNKFQNEPSNYSGNRSSNIYQPLRSPTHHSCASNLNKPPCSPSMTALSPMEHANPVQQGFIARPK